MSFLKPDIGPQSSPMRARRQHQIGALQRGIAQRRGADLLRRGLVPASRVRIVEQPRQMLEEAHVVGEDRNHRRAQRLLLVLRRQRRRKLLLRLGRAHEHHALRLRIRRGRPPLGQLIELPQLLVGHRLRREVVEAPRLAKEHVKRRIGDCTGCVHCTDLAPPHPEERAKPASRRIGGPTLETPAFAGSSE